MTARRPAPVSAGLASTGLAGPGRVVLAVALVAGAAVAWAALPAGGTGGWGAPLLVAACVCAAFSVLRLAAMLLAGRPGTTGRAGWYVPPAVQFAQRTWDGIVAVPWPQLLIVAAIMLEVEHPARPWHTAILGVVLLSYLLALQLAESGAAPSALRPQLPLIAAGSGLAALSAGAGLLSGSVPGAPWLAAIAAVAALIAAGLALPV